MAVLRLLLKLFIALSFLVFACSLQEIFEGLEFTRQEYNATIPENSVGKTEVLSTEKMGMFIADSLLNVRYKIVSGDPDRFFRADAKLVGNFWFLLIRVRTGSYAVLNREYKDTYRLTVRATITSQTRRQLKLKAQTEVVVHVLDTNDLNPLFYPVDVYDISVPEDTPLHRSVLKVNAVDPDLGINGEIYYSLSEQTLQFSIHPTRGTLTLTRPLYYQQQPFHTLTVIAEDRGVKFRAGDIRASSATVKVKVTPVNLHPPEILIRQFPTLMTPADPNIYAVVRVIDKDQGIHGELDTLEIIDGDPARLFKVIPGTKLNEFSIELDQPLSRDRSIPEKYTMTLLAKDKGTPPKMATQVFTVKLAEVLDGFSSFTQADYDVEIEEVSPPGSRVLKLATTAPKGLETSFKIENGNGNGTFAIHPKSGLLTTVLHLDKEVQPYYSLTVSAVDPSIRGPKQRATTIVNVRVLDNNDNNPVFNNTLETIIFDENRAAGSVVYSAYAADKDEGDNGYVTYSLANLNAVPFTIDPFTGEIRSAEILDYETMRREYILKIRASDWGSPYRRQAEMTLKIQLRDVNDHRPLFEKSDCVGYVSERAPLYTEILTLSAIDFDTGSSVYYRMVPSNDDPCFRLDPKTGVIQLTCDLAALNIKEKVINVSATDGTHFADVMPIRLKVVRNGANKRLTDKGALMECKDVGVTDRFKKQLHLAHANNRDNDVTEPTPTSYGGNKYVPEFPEGLPTEVWINESLSVGSEVTSIKARDSDRGYSGLLVYVISSGDEYCCFKIDLYSGRLTVESPLDREKKSQYELNISVFDLGVPQFSTSRTLVLHVDDVNDNIPMFEKGSYRFVLPENAKNGTSIVRLRASDKDEGINSQLAFTLETDLDEFHIDSSSGLLTVFGPLDRETKDFYQLKVRVTDGSLDNPLTSITTVNVRVLDINDNPPMFSLPQYWAKVREDLPVGVVIMVMPAIDPDLDVGGQVTYELSGDDTFSIDPLMGVVRLARLLDFESRQLYNITVSARDGGDPSFVSRTFLIVEVEDVNENLYSPQFAEVCIVGEIKENQPIGTIVTRVSAHDADGPGLNGEFTYSIRGGDGMGYFSIDNKGNIRTSEVLDRETADHYWLTVHAVDRGAVPLSGRVDVYIQVLDINDNIPLSIEPAYYPTVSENAPSATSVVQIKAFDLDLGDEAEFYFTIVSGDPQGYFNIDNRTGLITTTSRLLDRESLAEHALEIEISDNGSPPLSSLTRVVVTVNDTNDQSPEFGIPFYRCPVLEQVVLSSYMFLCQVIASDADIGENGNVTYFLMEGKGTEAFHVHAKTGAIMSKSELISGEKYDFLLKATDGGTPQRSTTTRVLIEILQKPTYSPSGPVLKEIDSHVAVAENDKVGHLVAFVDAEDPDGDRLWYYIIDGNIDDTFMIEPHKGAIRIARSLSWEDHQKYVLNISITDGIHIVHQELQIQVIDVNDHRPRFSAETFTIDIAENSIPGKEILLLEATDDDEDKRLFFSIYNSASPQSLQIFPVDSVSGRISLSSVADHEAIKKHILTVMVRDRGTPSKRSFCRVIIIVHDENDHHPEFLAPRFEAQVYETAALGTSVVQVLGIDKDKGRNAQLQFSFVTGNIGNAFTIDPILGTILVGKHLDKQTMPEYFMVVRATDNGLSSLNSTVTVHITITVANNAPPRFEQDEYVIELYENEKVGEFVTPIIATSRSSIYYEIVSGDNEDKFVINPTSGILRTNGELDFEVINLYNLSIRATNMVGANSTVPVLVHVLDRNDNPPTFYQREYHGEILESSSAGSLILVNSSTPLVIGAYDNDSEINSVLKYKILEKSALEHFSINSDTGSIKIVSTLDHETQSDYFFTVQVWDMGKPHLNAELPAKVHVKVIDVNDCPPYFEESHYTAVLLLPTYQGVNVASVQATDRDSISKIKYAFVSGNNGDKFHINKDSGEISVKDSENLASRYTIVIGASDGEFETSTKLIIKVQENQNSGFQFSKEKYFSRVQENSTEIHTVAIISVLGTALHEHLTFSILNPTHMFKIGETSGVVRTTGRMFDRELQSLYVLVVEIKNEPKDNLKLAHIIVEISVVDVNDNSPFFINLPYYAVIPVDAPLQYSVLKVEAVDFDSGANSEIIYEIVDGEKRTFQIDKETGEISIMHTPTASKYELVIEARDKGIPPLNTHVHVPIQIISKDMPVFAQRFYQVSVLENLPTGAPLLTVTANSPHGRKLIYSLVAGNGREDFRLDFNTEPGHSVGPCVFHVAEELDYETTPSYHLTLRATDSVTGIFSDVEVSIHVLDVNDNPPMFLQPSYNCTVSEAAVFGTSIMQVKATDRDSGANKLVQYHIVGNATSHFHVDSSEGIVFIKQPLDHETQREHYFAIMAADGGHPVLSSTAHVWVTVSDVNDNPPQFDNIFHKCFINQEVKRGQFVTMVIASDPDASDQSKLKYSITGGNDLQTFTINKLSGIITLSNLYNFNFDSGYALNVSVTDGVHSAQTAVHVDIHAANNHSPHFTRKVYEAAVPENSHPGRFVTTVYAEDQDIGVYGQVTYSIQSANCEKLFYINSQTGEICTKVKLDREDQYLHSIVVSAVDVGGRRGFAMVRASVTDENDNIPQFAVAEYQTTVPINMTIGTTVLKIQATDKDDGPSSALEYAIYKSNNTVVNELFGITHDNGEIYLRKSSAVGQGKLVYQFFVEAADRGSPSHKAVVPVNILFVDPKEDYPKFQHLKYEFYLPEKAAIGTTISTLNVSCSVPVKYTLTSPPRGSDAELYLSKFSIDNNGNILLMSEVDHEKQPVYYLNIRAETNTIPSRMSCADVTILIMDDNDNSPEFESNLYRVTVAENIEKGALILRVFASDADKGNIIAYNFGVDADKVTNIFQLDSQSGWLSTMVSLDCEDTSFYNFTINAFDNGSPSRMSTTVINIHLQDYNDNPPQFHLQHYNNVVPEDVLPGTSITTLYTTDRDEEQSNVDFYITDGNPQGQFQILHSGKLLVRKSLDREDIANYQLEITVTDGKFVSKSWVSIDVLDVNDNPPVCLKTKYTELVSESITPQTYILTVEATDADSYSNSRLLFSLSGSGQEDFSIDPITGILKTAQGMDREKVSRYILIAHVKDEGHLDWECTSSVEVLLSDVNDNSPLFTQEVYSVAVLEDSEVGTLITKVHATDGDLGLNRKISYSFVDSANNHFHIDELTGIIHLNKIVDREEVAMYNLTIQASDHGTPQLSSVSTLLVFVQDINDNPPEFTSKYYHSVVPETVPIGKEVLAVIATSRDSGINAEITYNIPIDHELLPFSIHPKSGVLSVSSTLDYETSRNYYLTVRAVDGGTPPLSAQVSVNITVTDSNDNAPEFIQSSYKSVIREDAVIGDKIIQVVATDADGPANSQLRYSILSGDRLGQFLIDKELGYISLASMLDREKLSNYILEILCEDSGTPNLSSTVLVNIVISDVNDNPPLFSEENYTAIVQEGKPLGFTVLKFTVTDQDSPPNTGPFIYDILTGNEDNAFRLVQQDATLRTANKFDHKNHSEYILNIRVTDGGNPPLASDTWVHILVIEESRYSPIVTPLDVVVSSYMDEFPGGVMGRVHAIDQDPYDKLFYSIVSNHNNLFTIDREDGTLVALPGLDIGVYEVNVSISDGKFTTYTTVSVDVTIITEEALKNSVALRLDDVTPEDFLLTFKKGFLRGLRNLLNVRMKDVEIISLQPAVEDTVRQRRNTHQDLDIVFAVRKGSKGYYSSELVRSKTMDKKDILEANVGLKVVKVMEDRCTADRCINGHCVDLIILDKAFPLSITTDAMSYVCPQHSRRLECVCDPGFGGSQCRQAVNECSRRPCPSYRVCMPEATVLGYICKCPEGKTGSACERNKDVACKQPNCYDEKTPVSFQGNSFISYVFNKVIDQRFSLKLNLRTKQLTGNIMFANGARDYSILEIVNGIVQYRFDCGSGEGFIRVEQMKINDGKWHEIKVERRGKRAEVIIDSHFHSSGSSIGTHEVLNFDGNDVYFGAEIHFQLISAGNEDIRMGFIGCMDDIQIDGISLPLHVNDNNPIANINRFSKMELYCGTLAELGVCGSQPCFNGGTCIPSASNFICKCHPQFLGQVCEIDTNPCASSPCLNGGTCHNSDNGYICSCLSRVSGKRCEHGYYCESSPCHNSGVCEEGIFGPICKCLGYHGESCQHDINECQSIPCAIGATCINMQGSFRCHCPPNMTGLLCGENLYTTSITSSSWNTTVEEIIGISVVIIFILLLTMVLVCCWRYRHKRQQLRPNNEVLDTATNEFLLKNTVYEKDNFNRISKISNLEVTAFSTPPLPPRPASYTPSTQDSVQALNNFDTVRSYGSAADDLENFPRQGNDYVQNISKPSVANINQALIPPSSSDNDSVKKGILEQESSKPKDKLYENKVHKDLKMRKNGDVPALHTIPPPVVPSRGPSSLGVPSILSLNSVDDLPGYIWDCSDWAMSQKPLPNIVKVSSKEMRDSSSIPSTESNSRASQVEILCPKNSAGSQHAHSVVMNHLPGRGDFEHTDSEYVGDSENNDNDFDDSSIVQGPNFENILKMTDLEFVDDGTDSLPSSPHKYQRHPNSYLPPHSVSTAETSPDHSWISNRQQICDLSDDEIMTYGFPPQGGRGFHMNAENEDMEHAPGLDSMSMSVGGYTSTNASYSDISGAVCEIDDSEANFSDVDYDVKDVKSAPFSQDKFCSTHL